MLDKSVSESLIHMKKILLESERKMFVCSGGSLATLKSGVTYKIKLMSMNCMIYLRRFPGSVENTTGCLGAYNIIRENRDTVKDNSSKMVRTQLSIKVAKFC